MVVIKRQSCYHRSKSFCFYRYFNIAIFFPIIKIDTRQHEYFHYVTFEPVTLQTIFDL